MEINRRSTLKSLAAIAATAFLPGKLKSLALPSIKSADPVRFKISEDFSEFTRIEWEELKPGDVFTTFRSGRLDKPARVLSFPHPCGPGNSLLFANVFSPDELTQLDWDVNANLLQIKLSNSKLSSVQIIRYCHGQSKN